MVNFTCVSKFIITVIRYILYLITSVGMSLIGGKSGKRNQPVNFAYLYQASSGKYNNWRLIHSYIIYVTNYKEKRVKPYIIDGEPILEESINLQIFFV